MITLAQIKAARALLNWTQDHLAHAAGLSLPGVNNLERGITSPRKETLRAIENTMMLAGVDFIDTTGVRLRTPDLSVQIIEGADWLSIYDADIISALKSSKDEIIQFASDNRLWMIYGSSTNHHYVDHRNKVNFKERILAPENIDYITSPAPAYRLLPSSFFGKFDRQVYGDRVANIIWEARKIVLIKSQSLADSERLIFNGLWETAVPFSSKQLKQVEQWDGNRRTSR